MSDRELFARSAERARRLAEATTDVSLRKLLDEMTAVFEARVADHAATSPDISHTDGDPSKIIGDGN